ncbi:hypothetical protein [Ureaplasma ceti]|uniref:Uncharacterized protein n=1 Tax=Ureaplasma ceti TaxID=3119530 RepID=A0ABP9U943_9BACT
MMKQDKKNKIILNRWPDNFFEESFKYFDENEEINEHLNGLLKALSKK